MESNPFSGVTVQNDSEAKTFLEALLEIKISGFKRIISGNALVSIFGESIPLPDVMMEDTDRNCFVVRYLKDENDGVDLELLHRCYQSIVDGHYFDQGISVEDVPEVYIIFICNVDHFGAGHAVYHLEDSFNGIEVDDGRHMIVLNSQYRINNTAPQVIGLLDHIRKN